MCDRPQPQDPKALVASLAVVEAVLGWEFEEAVSDVALQ